MEWNKVDGKSMKLTALFLFLFSLSLISYANFSMDGTRNSERFTIQRKNDPSNSLVYRVWESTESSPVRGDRVVFLFHGFCASQPMMYPLMREFTKLGYHVITADFTGHGESGGVHASEDQSFIDDFDQIYSDVSSKSRFSSWNWSHIAIIGHSMGGRAVIDIATNRSEVFTTVGIAPMEFGDLVNTTNPRNFAVIIGTHDQFFSPEYEMNNFIYAQPNAEFGKLYGNPTLGEARKIVKVEGSDHVDELMNDEVISESLTFVDQGFGFLSTQDSISIQQSQRFILLYIGVALGIVSLILFGLILSLNNSNNDSNKKELSSLFELTSQLSTKMDSSSKKIQLRLLICYIPGIILALLSFLLSLVLTPAGFGNGFIMIITFPGWIAYSFIYWTIKRNQKINDEKEILIKDLWRSSISEINGKILLQAILLSVFFLFIINFSLGMNFLMLLPLNLRAIYLLLWIPLTFLSYLFQYWFVHFLLHKEKNLLKVILFFLGIKYGPLYIITIIGDLLGSYYLSFVFLFTLMDIIMTLFLTLKVNQQQFSNENKEQKNNAIISILWASLAVPTAYMGYSVLMAFIFV